MSWVLSPCPHPGSMSLSAVCAGGVLRRSGGYSFAGELFGHGPSIFPNAPPQDSLVFVMLS
jgi:hypothetical protein